MTEIWRPHITVAAVIEFSAVWVTPDELRAQTTRQRSPMVVRCMQDYLAGKRYDLDLLTHFT